MPSFSEMDDLNYIILTAVVEADVWQDLLNHAMQKYKPAESHMAL